ncbi:uncharacterized protein LOC135110002 [Scylla paramamosain]|uniref:uncharacterized protein LOC135110002 n=1 Tax=Scylla paramamosain TaxID=85552 RepID=UPI00308396CF
MNDDEAEDEEEDEIEEEGNACAAVLTTRCQSATVPEASQGPLDAPVQTPTKHVSFISSTKERTKQQVPNDSFQYADQIASEADPEAELKGLDAPQTESHDSNAGSESDIHTRSATPLGDGEKPHGPHAEAHQTRYFVTTPYRAPSSLSPRHFGSGHSHRHGSGAVSPTPRIGRPSSQTIRPSYNVFSHDINVSPRNSGRYNTQRSKLSYPVIRHEKPDHIRFHSDKSYTPQIIPAKLEFAAYANSTRSHKSSNTYGTVRNQKTHPIKSIFSFVLPGTPHSPKARPATSYTANMTSQSPHPALQSSHHRLLAPHPPLTSCKSRPLKFSSTPHPPLKSPPTHSLQ